MRTVLGAMLISAFCAGRCSAMDAPVNHEGRVGDPAISQNIWSAVLYRWYRDCQVTGEDENSLACRKFYAVTAILNGMYPVDAVIANPNASASRALPTSRQQMKWFIVSFWTAANGQHGAFVNTLKPFDSLKECERALAANMAPAGWLNERDYDKAICAGNPAVTYSMKRMFPDEFK